MPLYQIQTKVNSQTINTDLEANSKDDALNFYKAVSFGEVLAIKEYLYINPSKVVPVDSKTSRYASVKMIFKNALPITIKIPSLKSTVTEDKIISHFRNLYRNIDKIYVNITSKK